MRQIVFAEYLTESMVRVTYSDGMISTFTDTEDLKAIAAQIERQQRESKDD
jgi:hypothetical protein